MREITPRNNNGSIIIQFSFQKKRYALNPGGKFDDDIALRNAERIADQITNDCVTGNFDPTLAKYKPGSAPNLSGRSIRDIQRELEEVQESLREKCISVEIWDKYVQFKRPSVSPSTIAKDYQKVRNYLLKCPKAKGTNGLVLPDEFRDFLLKETTPLAAKKVITQVSACCDWAIEERDLQLRENKFAGMAKKIKLPKSARESEIEAFTLEEERAIVDAFKSDRFCSKGDRFKHSKYASYVEFLFMTGCRPSEVIPLQWKHVSSDFKTIKFEQALVEGESGKVLKKGLKTQSKRIVKTSERLQELLKSIKPENCNPEVLVFPSPKGGYIDSHNFCNRQWKKVLEGLNIPYRVPYTTRHTLITRGLDQGIDAKDMSGLVGNSPKMIYERYAAKNKDAVLPE